MDPSTFPPDVFLFSDKVWEQLFAAIVVISLAWIQRTATKTQTEVTKVHTLVNSDRGVYLSVGASALTRVADLTKDPADRKIADAANELSAAHQRQQDKVDAKEK